MQTQRQTIQDIWNAEPIRARQWLVFFLCFCVAAFDGFDTQVIAFTGPAIAKTFGMAPQDMATIFIAGTLGMALGAMVLGSIGDRVGRRIGVLCAMALFAIFSFAVAFATSPTQIVALRLLTGLGMGGATPVVLALAAEYSPLRARGTVLTIVLFGLPLGAVLGGILAGGWLPVLGWQGMYYVGGAMPLALLMVCLVFLPESPQLLVARGRPGDQEKSRALMERVLGRPVPAGTIFTAPERAQRGSVAALFAPEYRMRTIAVWSTYLFNWIAWFTLLLWLPTVLASTGLPATTAALGTVTVNSAFILFGIPLALALPKLDVRRLLMGMLAFGAVICICLAMAGSSTGLVFTLIALSGFGVGGQQIALNYLISSIYPTELRATGTGWAIGIGRTGAIIGSALGGWLLAEGGVPGYYAGIALPLVIAAFAVAISGRGTAPKFAAAVTSAE